MWDVNESRIRRERGRLPVFCARRSRTDISNHLAYLRFHLRIFDQPSGIQVDALGGCDVCTRIRRKDLSGGPIKNVDITIAFRPHDYLPRLAVYREVQKNLFVYAVVIMQVVRSELIKPTSFTCVRIACKDSAGPLVITWTLIRVPWPRVSGAIEDEVLVGIVRDPTPGCTAADLPCIGWP